jgi:hypothetical protein
VPVILNESLGRVPRRLNVGEDDFVCRPDIIHFALRAFRYVLVNVEGNV